MLNSKTYPCKRRKFTKKKEHNTNHFMNDSFNKMNNLSHDSVQLNKRNHASRISLPIGFQTKGAIVAKPQITINENPIDFQKNHGQHVESRSSKDRHFTSYFHNRNHLETDQKKYSLRLSDSSDTEPEIEAKNISGFDINHSLNIVLNGVLALNDCLSLSFTKNIHFRLQSKLNGSKEIKMKNITTPFTLQKTPCNKPIIHVEHMPRINIKNPFEKEDNSYVEPLNKFQFAKYQFQNNDQIQCKKNFEGRSHDKEIPSEKEKNFFFNTTQGNIRQFNFQGTQEKFQFNKPKFTNDETGDFFNFRQPQCEKKNPFNFFTKPPESPLFSFPNNLQNKFCSEKENNVLFNDHQNLEFSKDFLGRSPLELKNKNKIIQLDDSFYRLSPIFGIQK